MLIAEIKIDYHDLGERIDDIAKIEIANESAHRNPDLGDYVFRIFKERKLIYIGDIKDFKRELGALKLVSLCINDYEENFKKER